MGKVECGTAYTVELGTPGSKIRYYVSGDGTGTCRMTSETCKPLTYAEARLARRLFLDGARKAGRPITCKIVALPRGWN